MQTTMPLPAAAGAQRPWYRHRWPWLLMLGPAVVVAAGSYTAWLAVSGQDALVVDDYYKQGRAINQDLSRDRAASRMLMASTLRYNPAAGSIEGVVTSMGSGYAKRVTVNLVHPTQPEKDIHLLAQPDAQGRFSVALPMLDVGRWQVMVEGERRDWRLNSVWQWPQKQSVELRADVQPAD